MKVNWCTVNSLEVLARLEVISANIDDISGVWRDSTQPAPLCFKRTGSHYDYLEMTV